MIDPEVLAVVQDFWSFPGTLKSGACFSECWEHVGTLASTISVKVMQLDAAV